MVNLPPNPDDQPPSGHIRDNDELIAVVVALLGIGTVLLFGWTRGMRTLFVSPESLSALDQESMLNEPIFDVGADDDSLSSEGFLFEGIGGAAAVPDGDLDTDIRGDRLSRNRLEYDAAEDEDDIGRLGDRRGLPTVISPAPRRTVLSADAPTEAAPQESLTSPDTEASPSDADTVTPPPLDISDVSEDYWAYPYIVSLYESDLLPDFPEGRLNPDNSLTRAEFAALLNSSFVKGLSGDRSRDFSDVSPEFWANEAIKQVVDTGYMSGYPDGTFKPEMQVPRYQVLVTLASGLELSPPENPGAVFEQFQGQETLPGWAVGMTAAAVENGIMANYPDPQQLAPQETATRAEVIAMIHQALAQQGRVQPVDTPYTNPAE